MFDESGNRPYQGKSEKSFSPLPLPVPSENNHQKPKEVPAIETKRPMGLILVVSSLGFDATRRLCAQDDRTINIVLVVMLSLALPGIMMGLMTMRRRAAELGIIYFSWGILSQVVIGIQRMILIQGADTGGNDFYRLMMMGTQVINIVLAAVFYGGLLVLLVRQMATGYFLNVPPSSDSGSGSGYILHAAFLGLLILVTITALTYSSTFLDIQLDLLKKQGNQGWF